MHALTKFCWLAVVALLLLAGRTGGIASDWPHPERVPSSVDPNPPDPEPPDLKATTVRIAASGCDGVALGSGVVVSGVVLTAAHVVTNAPNIVIDVAGTLVGAGVVAIDREADLAVLWAGDLVGGIALASEPDAPIGEPVTFSGFPFGANFEQSSGVARGVLDTGQLLVDVASAPGMSGGPAVDDHGDLVGVVVAQETATNSTLIVQGSTIVALLAEAATQAVVIPSCV